MQSCKTIRRPRDAPPLKKTDGRIDWRKEAIEIHRQVRAFNPWPGAFTEWEGQISKDIQGGDTRRGFYRKGRHCPMGGIGFHRGWNREEFFLH